MLRLPFERRPSERQVKWGITGVGEATNSGGGGAMGGGMPGGFPGGDGRPQGRHSAPGGAAGSTAVAGDSSSAGGFTAGAGVAV